MSNEYQNLSQLRSGNISSCYGIVVNFTTPKKTKAKGIVLMNLFEIKDFV